MTEFYLGDRGFLKKYNSPLSIAQIKDRMILGVDTFDLGLASGDIDTLRLACQLSEKNIYHINLRIQSPNQHGIQNYRRVLYEYLHAWSAKFVNSDPLVGFTYSQFASFKIPSSFSDIYFDSYQIEYELRCIAKYKPKIITLGGDSFDILAILGKYDILCSTYLKFRQAANSLGIEVAYLTYCGGLFYNRDAFESILDCTDYLMIPVNSLGVGMVPSRDELIKWTKNNGKKIIAIHCLAQGLTSIDLALQYIYQIAKPAIAIVGASSTRNLLLFGKTINLLRSNETF